MIETLSNEWLGKQYFLLAMDDNTKYYITSRMKIQSNTKVVLQEWIKMLETHSKGKVNYL